jgi:uncharacterized protein YjbJ (UPF0337 family)
MGANDEISSQVDDYMAGKTKEGLGEVTGDEDDKDTDNEGRPDQANPSLQDASEKVKDDFKN